MSVIIHAKILNWERFVTNYYCGPYHSPSTPKHKILQYSHEVCWCVIGGGWLWSDVDSNFLGGWWWLWWSRSGERRRRLVVIMVRKKERVVDLRERVSLYFSFIFNKVFFSLFF